MLERVGGGLAEGHWGEELGSPVCFSRYQKQEVIEQEGG